MKRLIILAAAWFFIILGAGWVWSTHDQTEYAELLDHYNLTEDAIVVATSSKLTLPQAAAKLSASKLKNLQVQFRASGQRVFLYAQGNYGDLPLASGQWFSDADLQSPLPVVVVGKAQTPSLLTGSHQQYLKQAGQYLPVLGIINSARSRRLNQAIFLNASGSEAASLRLNQVKIYADGAQIKAQKRQLVHVLGGKAKAYQYSDHHGAADWWSSTGITLMWSVLLIGASLLLAWLAAWFIQRTLPPELTANSRSRTLRGLWVRLAGYSGLTGVLGVMAANWWFYLSDRPRLIIFAAGLWVMAAAALYGLLMHPVNRKGGTQNEFAVRF